MAAPFKIYRQIHNLCSKFCSPYHIPFRDCSNDVKSELIRVFHEGPLCRIGINRPQKRNCINAETAAQLRTALEKFQDDQNAQVAVLHGIGGTFCAGYDLEEVASSNSIDLSVERGPMGPTRMSVPKPVIAAVDGYAVAGGFELALWCDLRVVEESAVMGVFCRRFGVPLMDGGTVRLPRLIGLGRALDLILTGRGIRGKEAHDMGLVTKLCQNGQALETAMSLARHLAVLPQECMNVDKNSAKRAAYDAKSLEAAFRLEMEAAVPVLKEASKGAAEFLNKAVETKMRPVNQS